MLSAYSSFWCQSIKLVPLRDDSGDSVLEPVQFGMWYRQEVQLNEVNGKFFVREVCVEYISKSDIDAPWKTARAFSILVLISGGLVTCFLWIAPCLFYPSHAQWNLQALVLLFCTFGQGLTFLVLNSNVCSDSSIALAGLPSASQLLYEDECTWDAGSTANVVGTVFWFVTVLVMKLVLKGPPSLPEQPTTKETHTVTYERTQQPDGGYAIQQTNVVIDNELDLPK
jgi:hypothetical protein